MAEPRSTGPARAVPADGARAPFAFAGARWADAKRAAAVVRLAPFDVTSPEGRSKERYRRIALNSLSGVAARVVTTAVGLVSVPLTLRYLGAEEYGLWAAITSFTTWMVLFDFGVVNGLVNSVSEAYGRDDRDAALSYVSTAFMLLVGIAAGVAVLFAAFLPWVPWARVFSAGGSASDRLVRLSVAAAVLPVLVALPLSVVRQVYAGYQKAYVGNLFLAGGALAGLGALLLALRAEASLATLILLSGATTAGALALNYVYLTRVEMPWLRPRTAACTRSALRRLMATSVPLFLFQIGGLLVNNSQLLILAHRSGLTVVTEYSVITRLYMVVASFIVLGTASFAPTFREAFERGDVAWLRRSFRRMVALRMALALGAATVIAFAGDWVLRLWLRDTAIQFGADVWVALAVLMLAATWASAYSELLTVLDHIWVQVGIVAANGLVTAALTFVLAPRYGVGGALLAVGCVSVTLTSWLLPIIARRRLGAPHPAAGAA